MSSITDPNIEIQRSKILAKGVLKLQNGQYEAVVVYAASTRYKFYWFYLLSSPRSPRRTWISRGCQMRPVIANGQTRRPGFREFMANRSKCRGSELVFARVYQPKRMKLFNEMGDFEFDKMLTAPRREVSEWEVRRLNQKFRSSYRGASVPFGLDFKRPTPTSE